MNSATTLEALAVNAYRKPNDEARITQRERLYNARFVIRASSFVIHFIGFPSIGLPFVVSTCTSWALCLPV